MKPTKVVLLLVLFLPGSITAQDEQEASKGDVGIGVGLDYGGIGGRFGFRPSPKTALFGGLGYNLNGLGYNFGGSFRISPDKRVVPYLSFMYGYNGVIVIEGASQFNKTYYGPSAAFGLEFHSRKVAKNYFNLELILPFRPQEFTNDLNAIKNNPMFKLQSEPWPIAISIGYHWGF